MLLDLDKLSVDELNSKLNTLNGRMHHLEIAGSHGSNAYAQCLFWMKQINYEIEERHYMTEIEDDPNWKPGLVSTIGEVPRPIIGEVLESKEKGSKDGGKR